MSDVELYEVDPEIQRVLVVVAHPDDVDFGMAGTVARLTSDGVVVSYCLVTSGDAGGDGSTHTKQERAEIREAEQTAAAAAVGVTDLTFLGYPDGLVEVSLALRKDIARVIRIKRPDVVLTQSPERNWERIFASHPDHLAAGEATMRAVYPDARNPHAFPELLDEGLEPHTVKTVWVGARQPNFMVDISSTIDRKIAALRCHVSQVSGRDDLDEMIRNWAALTASSAQLPEGTMAEGFHRVPTA